MLLKTVIPHVSSYLRQEVAPRVPSAELPVFISQFNIDKIKKTIGDSLWQNGVKILPKDEMALNPFSKALSTKSISTAADTQPKLIDEINSSDSSFGDFSNGPSLVNTKSVEPQPKNFKQLKLKFGAQNE